MLSRRDFIQSALAASALTPYRASARFPRGSASGVFNNSRVTLNAPAGYLNLAKNWAIDVDPTNMTSDGYPITTPGVNLLARAGTGMPTGYFGEFVWKWTGQGSMQIVAGPPTIVSSSTASAGTPLAVGDSNGGNQGMITVTAPRVQFLFGINIQSISNNGSGLIRIGTKTGFATNLSTGQIMNISGAATNTNANGTWVITVIDAQTFDLQGSTFANTAAVAGKAVLQATSLLSINITASGTFSNFAGLVWCKSGDEAAITAGQITDTVLLNQFKSLLNPNGLTAPNVWLRYMDFSGAQQNWEADFSQRITPTQSSYTAQYFRPGYWAGSIVNGGSDNYACSDPSISCWNGTSYIDNAIVQGAINVTNTGGLPTLAVGGHPAKPIYNYFASLGAYQYSATAPAASAGLTMQFTFDASWIRSLNGGVARIINYTTTTTGPQGNDTTSASALALNLSTAFQNDAVLSQTGIQYGNPFISIYPRTSQAGALSFTQTGGAAIITIQRTAAGQLANSNGGCSFMYNYLFDGWVYRTGGIVMAGPLEIAVEQANAVGAHVWWCWATNKGGLITSVANFFATNLNAGLRLGTEPGNELWNAQALPYGFWNALGGTLNFSVAGVIASFSYGALRLCQYTALGKAAWVSAGRSAGDYWGLQPTQVGAQVGGDFDLGQLKGAQLNRTGGTVNGVPNNTLYGTYGGLNGSGAVTTDYNISPNRPVDITNSIGFAPYWSSHWLGNGGSICDATSIVGTVTQNAPWLQAALDYMNGNTSTAFTSMANQFTGVTSGGSGNNGFNFADMVPQFTNLENIAAQYSGLIMMDYECAPSWGVGANGINGINSPINSNISVTNASDITAMATQFTNLGWNVSAFTQSGTNNRTEMATMAITMFQGWKYDITVAGAAANTGSYKNMIKTSYYAARNQANTHREAHAAQFAYAGASQWSLFATDYNATPYTSYAAIHEFNS